MGIVDWFKKAAPSASKASSSGSADADLFDEEFQRKLEQLALVSRRVFAGSMRAERRTKKTGSGVEFADHRAYAPGDDIRYLDWHAYQKFDRLLLRLYEEEEDLSIYFIIDASGSMGFGARRKLRYAKQLCAALAYVGLANLDRVTIVSVGEDGSQRMAPLRNKARIFRVFRFLERIDADGATDLEKSLKTFVAQHKRRGLAVLLSDLFDPTGFEQGINVLRYNKFEPLVLHVTDPAEQALPLKGDLRLHDCETGEGREVTVTAKILDRYKVAHSEYLESVEKFCKSRHVAYFRAGVDQPFEELILRVFRRGGFLR